MKVCFSAAAAAAAATAVVVFTGQVVQVAQADPGFKCTFQDAGDSSAPTCVADDSVTYYNVAHEDFRCCQLPASENADCDFSTSPLSEAQCDQINASNVACGADSDGFFAPGYVTSDPSCDDFAPDCLDTLSCDTDNGYEGTPWLMCGVDGGTFETMGCQRTFVDPENDNEVYLPYKFMNFDSSNANKKLSITSATDACAETNCAAIVANNGACNQLGHCSTLGVYKVFEEGSYTDIYPDVSTDLYVNPFRFMGIPEYPATGIKNDQNDADGIRHASLEYYSPMFDCYDVKTGFYRYRDRTMLQIKQDMSATGLVLDNFRFTQSVYDYIVKDLGVDENLLTDPSGEIKTTADGTTDPLGTHQYFGSIENGELAGDVPELAGKFVGGPLMCNMNNGQGCTLDGCAYMCEATDGCKGFSILDICDEGDKTDALRPTCAIIDALVAASGGTATFDRSKRAVCAFNYGDPDDEFEGKVDTFRAASALSYENKAYEPLCLQYSGSRCGECLVCDSNSYLIQGQCKTGNSACKSSKMYRDITPEWGVFRDSTSNTCALCPKHCTTCDSASDCSACSSALFSLSGDSSGCDEIGCTVDETDFPANSVGDANGASSHACIDGENVEPLEYCDLKCKTRFYQSSGSSLTAQCNGAGGTVQYPSFGCTVCSDANCLQCPGDTCTVCDTGYKLNGGSCDPITCPLAGEPVPNCTSCDEHLYGTISWSSSTSEWDISDCQSCSALLSNCLNCNGTSSANAFCIECVDGYILDENDDCIAEQYCPDGLEGIVTYNSGFDFTGCSVQDSCPKSSENAPDCWGCPVGFTGSVDWVRTNDTNGHWSEAQCEIVTCPTSGETSPACTSCPWGFYGTTYWDDETDTWAGCVSNDFGLATASAFIPPAAARSTTPVLRARFQLASLSADGSTVESVEAAPFTLDRQSSTYFYKNNGAFSTAESIWTCQEGFGGADCSLRLCPHSATTFSGDDPFAIGASTGLFWTTGIGQKSTATFHGRHLYRECAGRGTCDYTTGECECFDGFTGKGCRRRECPNSCSGHGICVDGSRSLYNNKHANGDVDILPPDFFSPISTAADPNLWSSESTQACVCDGGWAGSDCSLRRCPVGDDPETQCQDELGYDVQEISCSGMDKSVDHYFSLVYTGPNGHVYNTPPIIISAFSEANNATSTAASLQTALESLPNFAIPSVEVGVQMPDVVSSDFGVNLTVTFVDPANSGEQNLMDVVFDARCDAGSSSYFVNSDASFSCGIERVNSASGLREKAECSNRGLCNTRTGECACYEGYGGRACEIISATI